MRGREKKGAAGGAGGAGGKPRLPRFRMPPPGRAHRDRKKDAARKACRKFRRTQKEE